MNLSAVKKILFPAFPAAALLFISACSPKPTAREAELQKRIEALEIRMHTLEVDQSSVEKSAYSKFPSLKAEAQAEAKLATEKAQYETLSSLPEERQAESLAALGLASPSLKEMRMALLDVDLEITTRKINYQPSHPSMIALQEKRENLQKAIDQEAANVMLGLKTQLEISTKWVAALKAQYTPRE